MIMVHHTDALWELVDDLILDIGSYSGVGGNVVHSWKPCFSSQAAAQFLIMVLPYRTTGHALETLFLFFRLLLRNLSWSCCTDPEDNSTGLRAMGHYENNKEKKIPAQLKV